MKTLKRIFKAREISSLIFLTAIFLIVGAVNPSFLRFKNLLLIFNGSIVYVLLAVGIAFVIISGEIDVSIGATLGLAAAVSATLLRDGSSWSIAVIAALMVGAAVGFINGIGVTVLKIPSIIMTLGVNGVVRGSIYVYTNGKWVENIPYPFKAISQATIMNTLTYFFFGALLLMAVVHICLTKTNRGRYFAAVGDNESGANLIGIPVNKTKIIAFVVCGIFAAIAGVVYVSRVGFVTPTAGNGYEMKAIAACVLGGISLSGGVGTVVGATVGATIMSSISRVLVFLKFSSDYDNTITGILLIIIVVADALIQRRVAEKARRKRLLARTSTQGGAHNE
ncbi:ABC transporter permease [Cellulosilyticum sp. I15G10I2]|uniref:ABC transporter permease n=1 Tax=Cellulosilyticum sp. I15G10I2 TaxID=1892843 RepID=UPI00085CA164|nr:ABC transporter permease [Cellulosilyticum sp. I15G10I2]